MTKVKSARRNASHGKVGKPMTLRPDHKAIVGGATLFPNRVKTPDMSDMLFKSGKNNRKIGSHVTKGMWAGMPVYTLTLEERATCFTGCEHWADCYGNHMQWPTRWKAGPELERSITNQLDTLSRKHPGGYVIRLHVLGDFPTRQYVQVWAHAIEQHSALNVYGYTRWPKSSPQGKLIDFFNKEHPTRWRIRWSERGGEMGTTTTKDTTARGRVAEGVVCPAQTEGDEVSCGSCGLCWNSSEPIVFINH